MIDLVMIRIPWPSRRIWERGDLFVMGTESETNEFRIVNVESEENGEWALLTLEVTGDALRFSPEDK